MNTMERMLERLGDADPLPVLRSTGETLRRVAEQHAADELRRRPYEDKWTPLEIIGHLLDHEIIMTCRVRSMRFFPEPWLARYDQERMVAAQRHNEGDPLQFVERFEVLRRLNLDQYESADDAERAATRILTDGREFTLASLLRRHAAHDMAHLDQLERYLARRVG